MTLDFTRTLHPHAVPESRRAEIHEAPGFGKYFTDHMVVVDYDAERGWHNAAVKPYGPIALDPSAMVLHYGQEIFEGLKAYRQPDGSIAAFRPTANAERLQRSAARLAMPPLPTEDFINSLRELLAVDHAWVPAAGGEASLYIRPFMFASQAGLGVNSPSSEYRYAVIASPAGPYFSGGIKPVSVWLSREYVRAAPGGTGFAKCGGNYAAAFVAQQQATENGCDQVVWLDAVERRYIEEMGGMNLFFVFGSGADARLVTPELTGSLLPGITRDALLQLATDAGFAVDERRISIEELETGVEDGAITEVFACGTAAVITPVGRVRGENEDYQIADGEPGDVTMALRDTLTGIQRGTFADTHGWMTELYPAPVATLA
ncbi:branched-chain amino acid aminotransferase [Gordonia araii NBRC 100433]|uniref:Branched-chain-amino-acid aminotransferase n=1 Tax=Gordonia araii NBRC 100433 TaxID=1073574 RepID=G7H7J7_9ACTN|nr:branched-chain amino acid aminotransferase [Gordonia araii]NNG97891.1 branched-chain amino acid aminotransferase [Gordonia araii NBRC 100433]GAB11822.1 branched-chain amino acid aminotransferase [Gordonia araii NBRC 100433]